MHRLALTLALVPALLATGTRAQTVSDDIVKTLWCGEAFSALFTTQATQVDAQTKPTYDAFVAAAAKLIEIGTQGYLDAVNHPNFPSTVVTPQKPMHEVTVFKFSTQ